MEPWRPSASLDNLRTRAKILNLIRDFFAARSVMEVETPLLCHTSVPDPFIQSISALVKFHGKAQTVFLQTSPEYAMKRLLAAGSGAIYQITKAFRQDEIGSLHNPEFTMLEWYRPHFNHHRLMDEVDDLLQVILQTPKAERKTYRELFAPFGIDPHHASIEQLTACAQANNINLVGAITNRNTWLELIMSHCIEPTLGLNCPCFVYDFPTSMAALAQIKGENPALASRFEVYFHGIELANGFHELQDAQEQRKRFENNLAERKALNLDQLPLDENFLAALQHGLPDCAGVALGLDRLIMLATNSTHIAEVLSFDFSRA